jgi:hypothetical protein
MIDLPDAKKRLAPLVPILSAAHEAAVASWVTEVNDAPAFTLPLSNTTRANIIHNHLCAQVMLAIADMPGIKLNDKLGFFALMFEPDILLRFKYVGHGAPTNVATKQQVLLAKQTYNDQMMLSLAGDADLEPPTLLTCGHTIDSDKVGRIEIRCDCDGHVSWSYDIYGGDAVIMPQALPGQEDTAKPARIRKIAAQGEDAASASGAS